MIAESNQITAMYKKISQQFQVFIDNEADLVNKIDLISQN